MRHQHIAVEVRASADATTLYGLLREGASWPNWSPIESFHLEQTGSDEPEGVGAVRVFRKGRMIGRDQIVDLVPDRRFSYRHLSGLPVRDYYAEAILEPSGNGTRIRWTVSFLPTLPGTGLILRWAVQRFITQCARGLARYANDHGIRTP